MRGLEGLLPASLPQHQGAPLSPVLCQQLEFPCDVGHTSQVALLHFAQVKPLPSCYA